ncbi:MAG: glutamyl-tRNA reductase [Myxococcota bacterium]
MDLVCVGLNHRSAPVEIREKVAFRAERIPANLKSLLSRHALKEAVILSTCNRVEIYVRGNEVEAAAEVASYLHAEHSLLPGTLTDHLYIHNAADALRHLFRVASSLDAIVVGEPQILGQVKDAFRLAVDAQAVGPLLSRVFHRAFGVAKRVRSETAIAQSAVSVSYAAVELARTIFGNLQGSVCLLVGAGNMSELAARHFVQEGAQLWVVNRSYERAEALATAFGGSARTYNDLPLLLEKADVVLTSTAAPGFIVTKDMMKGVMRARRYNPIFFIDISVPRNVDPAITSQENVYVYDVDDLSKVVDKNLEKRRAEAERAERLVLEEVEQFKEWARGRTAVPVIKALRARAQTLVEAEVKRTLATLGPHVTEKERKSVTAMVNAVVNKLLHEPTTALKGSTGDSAELVDAARRLFNLADEELEEENGSTPDAARSDALAALKAADEAEAAGAGVERP